LPHTVNASHIKLITHVHWGSRLLKLIDGDIVYVLSGSRTYQDHGPITWCWTRSYH